MEQIGFIGLGRMGRPMAANLVKRGFTLTVRDIDSRPVAYLVERGAHEAADLHKLAQTSDIVVTMLPNSQIVKDTLLGPDGVIAHARPGTMLLEMSTIDPTVTDQIAKVAGAKGIGLVDAPVGRLASHADRGECLFMVGADPESLARVKPLLDAMGTTVLHCGPVGSGMRMKLVNNFLAVASCQLNAEALALSQALGLDLNRTMEVLNGTSAYNGQLQLNWKHKSLTGDITPGFTIDLAHKDLSLILEAANALRLPMPMGAAAREMFSAARAGKYASADFSAMGDALCDLAGLEKPRLRPAG